MATIAAATSVPVTTGRLAWELMTGQLQLGDSTFEQHNPSSANVAGDPDSFAAFDAFNDAVGNLGVSFHECSSRGCRSD